MAIGIIYIMTTVVSGLIKIGKTASTNFEQRMYQLEHHGYSNVTGLKRRFAIEVEDYDDKEKLLHTIFEKSRLSDTELFAIDVNVAVQLLSSFAGRVVYPKPELKVNLSTDSHNNVASGLIPDGIYYFERKKKSENRVIMASAVIHEGKWMLLKGSVLGIKEQPGATQKAKDIRALLKLDKNGKLLEDFDLGNCNPSLAAGVLMNMAIDGWLYWKNEKGQKIDIYRK